MSAKPKTAKAKKAQIKVRDLKPKKNPSGGKVKVHDIVIVKQIDKSSPTLFQ